MKKNIFLILFFLIFVFELNAQKLYLDQQYTDDRGIFTRGMIASNDNGFLAYGHWNANLSYSPLLTRFDSNGKVVWSKEVTSKAINSTIFWGKALKNGDFLFYQTSVVGKGYLFRTDANANVLWTLNNQDDYFAFTAFDAVELNNGDIVVSSYSTRTVQPGSILNSGIQISRITAKGDVKWRKAYFLDKTSKAYIAPPKLCLAKDETIVAAFDISEYTQQGNKTYQIKLAAINPDNGKYIWQRNISTPNNRNEQVEFISQDEDGNYFIACAYGITAGSQILTFLKFDPLGNPLWRKDYPTVGGLGISMAVKPDGNFMALGSASFSANFYFTNIDKNGMIKSLYFDLINATFMKTCYLKDGRLLVFGVSQICPQFTYSTLLQVRNEDGKTGCATSVNGQVMDKPIELLSQPYLIEEDAPVVIIKTSPVLLADYFVKTKENKNTYCPDTTETKICSNGSIKIGTKTYNKPGIYKDTIVGNNCFEYKVTKIIANDEAINTKIDTAICDGEVVFIGKNAYKKAGNYTETFKNQFGCDSTISLSLKIKSLQITAPKELKILQGEKASIKVTANLKNVLWNWTPPETLSCSDCDSTIAEPTNTTIYTVKAQSPDGCVNTQDVKVIVEFKADVFIPTIFSPNDDGINERLIVFANRNILKINFLKIYDRWGNLVFEGNDFPPNEYNYGWDGKNRGQKTPSGVYVYRLDIALFDGTIRQLKGDVFVP